MMEKRRWRAEQVVNGEQGRDAEKLGGERGVQQAAGKLERKLVSAALSLGIVGSSLHGQGRQLKWGACSIDVGPPALSFSFSSFLRLLPYLQDSN